MRENTDPGPEVLCPEAEVPPVVGGAAFEGTDFADGGGGLCVTVGEIFRKDLKPTYNNRQLKR